MAVHVHAPRGLSGGRGLSSGGFRDRRHLAPVPELRVPELKVTAFKAWGLAVWVTPAAGQEIDEAVMMHAARLVLERALGFVPQAEVHWPAAAAATSAVGQPAGEGNSSAEPPDGGTQAAPSSTVSNADSSIEADDDGVTHLPPSASPTRHVAVDLAQGEVLLDGGSVALTGVEFKLLRYLVENCSRAISREELRRFLESFDSPAAAARSIDVYVGRVRRKLGGGRHVVATVRGGGYQFIPGPAATVRGPAEYSI